MDDDGVKGLAGACAKMGSEGDVLKRFLEDGGDSGRLGNARVLEDMLRATDVPIVDSSDIKLGKKNWTRDNGRCLQGRLRRGTCRGQAGDDK